jgi:hypothetical protein
MTAPRGGEKVEPPATRHMRMPPTFKGFRTAIGIAKRDGARPPRAPNPYQTRNPKAARPSKAKRKISPSRVEHDNRRKEPSADPRADQKARSAARSGEAVADGYRTSNQLPPTTDTFTIHSPCHTVSDWPLN